MGYTTEFEGIFNFDRPLDPSFYQELMKIHDTRHGGSIHENPDYPSMYCQWQPNQQNTGLVWDGGEKFYEYIPWLKWLIENRFKPNNYTLNGKIFWYGEECNDIGTIEVKDNIILVTEGTIIHDKSETVQI